MSVSDQETEFPYTGNGVTVTFPYNCQVQKAGDLDVYLAGVLVTSGFSINGIGSLSGGSVTFATAPAAGVSVVLERVVDLERTTDYQQNGDFLARVVNPDFDRLWMALQQFRTLFTRALRFPRTDANPITQLPPAADRANKIMGFDGDGNPLMIVATEQTALGVLTLLATNAGASLIGWFQSGIGAIRRTVQDKLRENVSVQDFSATLLADNVDVTAALQAAIASLPDGGVIKFPRGKVLLISAEIAMSSRITLDLNRCTLRQASGSNLGNMIFIGAAANDVYIHDGKIDINRANQVYAGAKGDVGRGVFAYQANGTRVYRVDFMNPYGSMILAAACVDTIVERCNFDDQNATGHHGVEFNSCTRPYALWNKGSGKLGLTGYAIYAHGPTIRPWAMFNSFQYWQIDFIGDDYITAGTESTMIYGRIEHNTLLDPSADTSIHFGLYGSVCNNTIINSRDVGISMDYSRNTVINNNVIRTTNAAGIAIPGCIDCTIANNQLSNVGSQFVSPVQDGQRSGIWAPIRPFEIAPSIAPSGNVISGNSIRDSLAVPKMYYGISVANVGGNNVNYVKGNYVFGSIGADLDLPPQTNIGSIEQRKFPVLLNSWVSAGAGVPDLGFYKDDIGNVYLSGIVAGGALNLPIAMLPAGYRPAQKIEFLVRAGTGVGQASIFTDGSILLENGSNTRVSFNLVFTIR